MITEQENAFVCSRCYNEWSRTDKCAICGTTREADKLQGQANAKSGIHI